MTVRTGQEINDYADEFLPDNTTRRIKPEHVRTAVKDIGDSLGEVQGLLADRGPLLFVGDGQSNMVGNGTGGDVGTINSSVYAFNWSTGLWAVARPGINPLNTASTSHNNLLWAMAKLAQVETGRPVFMVLRPIGGSSITTHLSIANGGDGTNWSLMQSAMAAALARPELNLIGKTKADVFAWHQGEADELLTPAVYTGYMRALIAQVRGESWGSSTLKFIAGETLRIQSTQKQIGTLREMAVTGTDPWFGLVSSNGITTADNIHADGAGLDEFGRRYWGEYNALPRPFAPFSPAIIVPNFSVHQQTTASNVTGDNTVYQVIWDTNLRNGQGLMNTSTGVAQIPISGTGDYEFDLKVTIGFHSGTAATYLSRCIVKIVTSNQTYTSNFSRIYPDVDGFATLHIREPAYVAASENILVTVQCVTNDASKTIDIIGSSANIFTRFTARRLLTSADNQVGP